jgi:hypothetical protein
MMIFTTDPLEIIWDGLLSRDPARIRASFASLNPADQCSVLTHLKRMATETGWLPVQQISAQSALDTLIEGEDMNTLPME